MIVAIIPDINPKAPLSGLFPLMTVKQPKRNSTKPIRAERPTMVIARSGIIKVRHTTIIIIPIITELLKEDGWNRKNPPQYPTNIVVPPMIATDDNPPMRFGTDRRIQRTDPANIARRRLVLRDLFFSFMQ